MMTRTRPLGISFISFLFLLQAILAVGIAAFLLLVPNSSEGITTLGNRLQLPTAFNGLLAVPPLLTAALAGLIFRGLWDLREWARLAAIVFSFLLTLAAVVIVAFLTAFELGGGQNLLFGYIALIFAVGVFIYLLIVNWDDRQSPEVGGDAAMAATAYEPTPQPYVEKSPASTPPPAIPRHESDLQLPYDLVPPPPRPSAASVDRQTQTVVASPNMDDTHQIGFEAAMTPAAVDNPIAWLIVRQGPELRERYALYPHSSLTFGRDKSRVNTVLTDPAVSARHIQIRHEQGRFVVSDLGSTNGTMVNGKRIQRQTILEGDEICLGSTVLLFTTSRS